MRKRLWIALVAMLCFLGIGSAFMGCKDEPVENPVLALGVEQSPTKLTYEVGQYVDVTGGKLAVVYANDSEQKITIDLTEEMLDKNSYDINVAGKKDVIVKFEHEGKAYFTRFTVTYEQKPFRTDAIKEIESYKADVEYSTNGKKIVEAYKLLAVANIKLAATKEEAESMINTFKAKLDSVITKAQEDALNTPSPELVKAISDAVKEINAYKDATYKAEYAEMIAAYREIAKAEIATCKNVSEVKVALSKAKANIDTCALGNKTLDEINNAKLASEQAQAASELAKQESEKAADKAKEQAEASEQAKLASDKAQVEAEKAKTEAEKAQKAAEDAKALAEKAKADAEAIKADVTASQAEVSEALTKALKAALDAENAKLASIAAQNEANQKANEAEASKLAAEAAKIAAENAEAEAKTAKDAAVAAQNAAALSAQAAKDYLDEIEKIYNALPQAATYIAEVQGYVNDADYSGINKLLVVSLKDSYVAAIKASRSEQEIQLIVTSAKAALDLAKTDAAINAEKLVEEANNLVLAKANAKAELKAYINMLEYKAPAGIDLSKYENLSDNPDEAKLVQKIEKLIADTEAEIDAATTVQEVANALAKGQGKAGLETIYVDFYASCVVTELVEVFRKKYEPIKILYTEENYNILLNIVKHYETYIGRIDKLDEVDEKYDEAIKKLEDVDTISGEIAAMIEAISYPIRLNVVVDDANKAHYYSALPEELFDSKVKELDPIQVLLDKVDAITDPTVKARILSELTNYTDKNGVVKNVISMFNAAKARYAKLVDAKAAAESTGSVIDLINVIPGFDGLTLITADPCVKNARDAWKLLVETYFELEGCPVLTATGEIDVTKLETINLKIVTNYNNLVVAEARVKELEAAKAQAAIIDAKIEAIDDAYGYIVLDSEVLYNEVIDMIADWKVQYNINSINEYLITKSAMLPIIEARINELKAAKADAETAVTGEIALIDVIIDEANGEYITLADKDEIETAETEFNAWKLAYNIPDAETVNLDIVTNRNDLTTYRARYDQLVAAKADAESTTGVIALIDAIPTPITLASEPAVVAARTAYDAWKLAYAIPDSEPINLAMITNNNALVEAEARIEVLKAAKADAETPGTGVIALIKGIINVISGEYITLADKDEIEAAEAAYEAWKLAYDIDPANEYLVTNYADLVAYRARYDVLVAAKANAETDVTGTISLIDVIIDESNGEYITLADKDEIETAEAAYEAWKLAYAIPDTEPINLDIVTNRKDLTTYRARYDQLVAAKADAETPTTGVIALIDVLPTPITLDNIDLINTARIAYNKWIADYEIPSTEPINLGIITNFSKLSDAENRYNDVLVPLRDATIAAVNAIGTVSINSGSLIAAAEAKYLELVNENPGVDFTIANPYNHLQGRLEMLINARRDYELSLYVDTVEKSSKVVEDKYNELIGLMGDHRTGDDKLALFNVSKDAKIAYALIPHPVKTPHVFGDWTDERVVYQAASESVQKEHINKLYEAAKYIVEGNSTDGYVVTIYQVGTYTSFITIEGAIINTVKEIKVDSIVTDPSLVDYSAIIIA